jgi:hypothetical protein
MQSRLRYLLIPLAVLFVCGCSNEKSQTPPQDTARFYALLDSLRGTLPGYAATRLEVLLREYDDYQIADTVQTEIDRFRATAGEQYQKARELARQGEFDRAERILNDLATNLADTPEGDTAKRHLEFEFYFGKAKWLLYQQRFAECEEVSRDLLERDLTLYQVDQVQAILDNLAQVDVAVSMSERAETQNAVRHLSMLLTQKFVEDGQYPTRLTIREIERWGPHNSEYVLRGLSAIEDYRSSGDTFSFTGVSKSGRFRVRVIDGRVQDPNE